MIVNNRKAFLSAVDEASPTSFLHFIELHHSKNDSFDLEELLQALSRKEHERLWSGLKKLCDDVLNMLSLNEDDEDDENLQQDMYMETLLQCLYGIVVVASCSVSLDEPVVPQALFETALYLHGMLMHLGNYEKIQNGIAQLCETWFLNDFDGKEELVTHTIPYLVCRSIASNTVVDIKRVWGLRQGLMLLDFEDDSCASLKLLLHQCLLHPLYLKHEEGRRFLSFMFGLNPEFSKALHKSIKNQIPTCKMPALAAYGEVYFRAWRVASGPYLEVLESHCIQDLMYHAAHAQRSGAQSMASRLRKVLHYFHQQKKQKGVDETLARLYQPIIWRALKAANHQVRANAVALLVDAFPLQNPDSTNEEIDALLQEQFDILQELLDDPSQVVRATVVHGVAGIAGVYWELIPAHTVKKLISKLVNELAFDGSSSSVRLAVFQGLKFLLDCRLSHPLLKSLLGNLRNLIHDNSEKVRVAFLELLLLVKGMKAIKFWKIVPMEHLLARLEVEDSSAAMRRLVKLLMNSFLPATGDPNVQVVRCMYLWNANPRAARKFYQYVPIHSTVPNIGRFVIVLCRCLIQCAQPNTGNSDDKSPLQISDCEEENSQNNANTSVDMSSVLEGMPELLSEDASVIVGLLETVAILWAGVKEQLNKNANENIKSRMVHHFSQALPLFFAAFENVHARAAIILIAGNLPSSTLPKLSNECMTSLSSLRVSSPRMYGPILNSLNCWDRTGDVLSLVSDWLSAVVGDQLNDDGDLDAQAKTHRALLALDFLAWLRREPTCCDGVRQLPRDVRQIADTLKQVMERLKRDYMVEEKATEVPPSEMDLYTRAFETYYHLAIHLQGLVPDKNYLVSEVQEILEWSKGVLLPQLDRFDSSADETQESHDNSAKRRKHDGNCQHKIATSLMKTLLESSSEVVLLGLADDKLCCMMSDFMNTLIQRGPKSLQFLHELAKLMFQIAQRNVFSETKEGGAVAVTLKICTRNVEEQLQRNVEDNQLRGLREGTSAAGHSLLQNTLRKLDVECADGD